MPASYQQTHVTKNMVPRRHKYYLYNYSSHVRRWFAASFQADLIGHCGLRE